MHKRLTFVFTRMFFYFMFLMDVLSSSTKEINRLISKGMCAILFDAFNECSLTFTTENIEKN